MLNWLNFLNSSNPWLLGIGLNSVLLFLVWIAPKKLLTLSGIINAWILGVLIWGCLGWQGYVIVSFYFVAGSGVTRIKIKEKEAEGIAEKRSGARGAENVWGSAATAAFCALGILLTKDLWLQSLLVLGYVASFSTKLSDTTASEIGKAYGKRTFLITTFQAVPRGTEGAVSLEGTVAGILASLLMAGCGYAVGLIDVWGVLWCTIAALMATTVESIIGATIQESWEWMTNEVVNGINTLIGAVVAMGLMMAQNYWF
jgi:uncharacterized protein (TIGR00297 family)